MRLHVPRVLPVEVWDFPVEGRLLQAWRHEPFFPEAVARVVRGVRESPPTDWTPRARELARNIRHVHLMGGGAELPGLLPSVVSAGVDATVAPAPRFIAARMGATRLGLPDAVCLDVGQTSIKLATRERLWCVERDLTLAPMRDTVPQEQRPRVRNETVRYLASVFAPAVREGAPVVLALPCEWTEEGLPMSCSYCWPARDAHLLADLAAASGFSLDALHVLNDAELAAAVADADPRLPSDALVLVLTIGFGVGGALLERAR